MTAFRPAVPGVVARTADAPLAKPSNRGRHLKPIMNPDLLVDGEHVSS